MRVSKGWLAAAILISGEAGALPIGFQTNQGPLEYSETKSDHFTVYHDKRVPEEGQAALNALEAARPYIETWFQQQRRRPLPVVMSAVTENASFANFILDAVELQTMGQGSKELAWHEYTHSTMYRSMDNIFGPAGNIIHLPWMPAWFLEGLAEAMSVSAGSDVTAGIERYQALTGDWPTYDRLHSLYSKAGFFERGYSTSGAMVSYALRKGDANRLPLLLKDFYDYTMPWWWPWSMVPFNDFLPLDAALENYMGVGGEAFFEQYKQDAKAHWEAASKDRFLVGEKDKKRRRFTSLYGLRSGGDKMRHVLKVDDELWEVQLTFDEATGWANGWKKVKLLSDDFEGTGFLSTGEYATEIESKREGQVDRFTLAFSRAKTKPRVIKRTGILMDSWQTKTHFVWLEIEQSVSRICTAAKAGGKVECPVSVRMPLTLRGLAEKNGEIWYREYEEKLPGNRYQVKIFDPVKKTTRTFLKAPARAVAVGFAGKDTWLLLAERNQRVLRRYDDAGQCQGMVTLKDHILDVHGQNDGSLVVGLYAGDDRYVYKFPKGKIPEKACAPVTAHTSPLQYALLKGGNVDLKTAVVGSSLWTDSQGYTDGETKKIDAAKPADKDVQANTGSTGRSRPAAWRGRPAFAFPWIGADDALGPQFGIVSVPLVDQMQNESVRATFLYGPASRFPYQEVALITTRFKPTLTLTGYRQQTYNGRFQKIATGEIVNSYLDEKGARFEADQNFRALGGGLSVGAGVKYAHLKPYIGPEINGHGWLAEPGMTLGLVHTFGRFSWSNGLAGRVAPEQWNTEFDYNQLGASTTLGVALPFLESRASMGLEGSRTRGKKRRDVMEVYRPLKTYVPGSGGGYNQNSFPIGDADTGLFAPVFGDTQGRAKANWTMPIIRDLDQLFWILYLERLDFTAFYNYGAAWNGDEPSRGWDRLIRAHGYNVDLQLENKGVRFNLGTGVGQVVGRDFEVYITTGFDALF